MPAPAPDRPSTPQRHLSPLQRAVGLAVTAALAATVAACSSVGDRDVAQVTLPELASTTTTTAPPTSQTPADTQPPPVVWTVQLGGPGDDDLAALAGHEDTVVVIGSTTAGVGDAEGTAVAGGSDVLTAVVDTEAVVLSLASAGSTGADEGRSITVSDGAPFGCGTTTGTLGAASFGGIDLWCAELGDDASIAGPVTQLGGPDDDVATGVAAAEGLDHLFVAAYSLGALPGAQDSAGRGAGGGDALMVQLQPDGSPVWARHFGTRGVDAATAVAASPDGDGIAVGFTDGDLERASSGGRDAWISRFDPRGYQRWITQLGTGGIDELNAVAVAGEARRGTERFVAAGTTDRSDDATTPSGTRNAFVTAVSSDGTLLWRTTVGSDDATTSGDDLGTAITSDGSIVYVAGTTSSGLGELLPEAGPGGGSDGFLSALDAATGEVLWVARFGSSADEQVRAITTTEDGLLVVAGVTTGQMAEDEPHGAQDGFLIAFPLSAQGGGAASSV